MMDSWNDTTEKDTIETRKWSFISAFSICMTVPLN